jgi:predicted outer membrane repeat protein
MLVRPLVVVALCALAPATALGQSFCTPVAPTPLVAPTVLGDGTPGSVTTAQLQAALDAGGHILLDQGAAPSTVVVTTTLVATREIVLDGGGRVTLSGGGVRRILTIVNPNPAQDAPTFTVALQNLGFRDGVSNGGPAGTPSGRGGAIYKHHDFEFPHKVALKLANCSFAGNDALLDAETQDDGGGALYAELMLRIDVGNCTFDDNSGSNGGAVYSLGTLAVNVVDSAFTNNRAIGTGGNPGNGGNAGALGVDGANRSVDVCRTRFVGNTSNAYGAGFFSVMYPQFPPNRTRFEDVVFERNRQLAAGQHTGGAYIQDGPWALERVSFVDNEAEGFGGLGVFSSAAGNAPGTIRNATFVGNVARVGLGAAMTLPSNAAITVANTTIANNVSTQAFAAGIQINAPNQLRLTNTVLANNTGGNVFVDWNIRSTAAFDGGGNVQWPPTRPINGGAERPATATVLFADPQLAADAADNGGLVPTIAIAATSPARDFGADAAETPATDARGSARVGAPDAGSYEYEEALFADGFE